jgi:hypothetical protein
VAAFREAVQVSDAERCWQAVQALQFQGLWRRIVRSIMGMNPSDKFRRHCLESWIVWGDSLRNEIGDDLLLIELLGVLMTREARFASTEATTFSIGVAARTVCPGHRVAKSPEGSLRMACFAARPNGVAAYWKRTPRMMRSSARQGYSTTAMAKTNLLSIAVDSSELTFLSGSLKRRSRNTDDVWKRSAKLWPRRMETVGDDREGRRAARASVRPLAVYLPAGNGEKWCLATNALGSETAQSRRACLPTTGCKAAPLRPHLVQRTDRHLMISGTNAIGARCRQRSQTTQH